MHPEFKNFCCTLDNLPSYYSSEHSLLCNSILNFGDRLGMYCGLSREECENRIW
jgi:hypothetical protein